MTSILKVDSIQNAAGTVIMPVMAGGIIQTQFTQFTGTNSLVAASASENVLTDLTVNITPTSASSVIRIQAHVFGEYGSSANGPHNSVFFFYRDTTKLSAPNSGSRASGITSATLSYWSENAATTAEVANYDYYDTPNTTSQITYKVGIYFKTGQTYYLNRTVDDSDNNGNERGISAITVMEIAQ